MVLFGPRQQATDHVPIEGGWNHASRREYTILASRGPQTLWRYPVRKRRKRLLGFTAFLYPSRIKISMRKTRFTRRETLATTLQAVFASTVVTHEMAQTSPAATIAKPEPEFKPENDYPFFGWNEESLAARIEPTDRSEIDSPLP